MLVDAAVTPVLGAVRDCAAYWFGVAERPVTRFPITVNGGNPPMDACDCAQGEADGQAYVRMVTINSVTEAGRMADCASGRMFDLTIEVGVYRCWPTPSDGVSPLPTELEERTARGLYIDAAVLRRAVMCCSWLARRRITPTITTETAIGPMGGCVGIELQAQMQVADCDCDQGVSR